MFDLAIVKSLLSKVTGFDEILLKVSERFIYKGKIVVIYGSSKTKEGRYSYHIEKNEDNKLVIISYFYNGYRENEWKDCMEIYEKDSIVLKKLNKEFLELQSSM